MICNDEFGIVFLRNLDEFEFHEKNGRRFVAHSLANIDIFEIIFKIMISLPRVKSYEKFCKFLKDFLYLVRSYKIFSFVKFVKLTSKEGS